MLSLKTYNKSRIIVVGMYKGLNIHTESFSNKNSKVSSVHGFFHLHFLL